MFMLVYFVIDILNICVILAEFSVCFLAKLSQLVPDIAEHYWYHNNRDFLLRNNPSLN